MTNRKLKKILKQNAIDSEKQAPKHQFHINITRRALIRLAQTAACLLLVAAMGVGYVAMVRMVGPQGSSDGTTPSTPSLQPTDTLDPGMDTVLDVVETCPPYSPDDTTYQMVEKHETFTGKKLVLAETFKVGVSGDWWEFSSPDMTADTVDMINLNRIMSVERALQCNIMQSASAYDHFINWVKVSSLTGNDAAIVAGSAETIGALARQGLLEDMLSATAAEYLEFSAPYWNPDMAQDLKIGNKLYFVSGTISINTMGAVNCVFTDPNINSKLGIDIYSIVEEGKWTFDKMYALAAGSGSLNGLALNEPAIPALALSAGIRLADNTPAPHRSLSNGTALDFTEKLAELVKTGTVTLTSVASSEHIDELFVVDTIVGVTSLGAGIRAMLPMPAVEEGAPYLSPVGSHAVYYGIVRGSDVALASATMAKLAQYSLEVSSSEASNSKMQTYMDVICNRYPISAKSAQNVEIAMSNMTFSLDAFLPSSVTLTTLKNAISAASSNARREILTQNHLAQVIEEQLGKIK